MVAITGTFTLRLIRASHLLLLIYLIESEIVFFSFFLSISLSLCIYILQLQLWTMQESTGARANGAARAHCTVARLQQCS